MTDFELVNASKTVPIFQELLKCNQSAFSGLMKIDSSSSREVWEIYLYNGQIAWAAGGHNENRRWRRYILQTNFSQEADNRSSVLSKKSEEPIRYRAVMDKLQKQEISTEQVGNLIKNIVLEIVFDLVMQSKNQDELTFSRQPFPVLSKSLVMLNSEQVCENVLKNWQQWEKIGGATISPNLLPLIIDQKKFQAAVPAALYNKLNVLLDGKRSLRDLAVTLKQDLGKLLTLLIPFYKAGILDLVEIPEISRKIVQKTNINPLVNTQKIPKPLIICIDDNLRVCQTLEKVVKTEGGDFLGIQDPLQALPVIIERKPQLIFLDVVMPVINGYELCSQIRKVPGFKETPIAILTGNDGVVDRVRAKMAGASCFVSKLGDTSPITKLIRHYCRST